MSRVDTRGYAKAKICGERIAKERRGHDMTGTEKELNGAGTRRLANKKKYKFPLFNEKKCRGCGKIIFVTPDWVFKRGKERHPEYFCKYTCMKRYDEEKSAKKRAYMSVK